MIEQRSPVRVVLVVTDAARDEVDLVGGDGGEPDREVREFSVDPRPARVRGRRVGGLQRVRARDLAVDGGVAELAGVGGVYSVAWDVVAAGELANEVVCGGEVGAPAAVDDLRTVARVVGVREVDVGRENAQRGVEPELSESGRGILCLSLGPRGVPD